MKLISKVIDPVIDAAYFTCRLCDTVEMTRKDTVRAEYSSAFARFKQQHQPCLDDFWNNKPDSEKNII